MTFLTGVLFLVLSAGIASAAPEAICSDPNVIFCDNFDDRAIGTDDLTTSKGGKTLGWGVSPQVPGQLQRVTNSGCLEGNCLAQDYRDLTSPVIEDNGGGGVLGGGRPPQKPTNFFRVLG